MKPGPAPRPSHVKLLEGIPGRRPLPSNEPKPRVRQRVPSPPPSLGEEGQKEWRRLGSHLCKLGLLTDLDLTAFHMYCDSYESWRQYAREARKGPVIRTPNGYLQRNPYVGMANTAFRMARAMLAEFGLTPAARSRVVGESTNREGNDELMAWLLDGKVK